MSHFEIINNYQYIDINSLKEFASQFLNARIDELTGQAVYHELMNEHKKQNRSCSFINSLSFMKSYLENIDFKIDNEVSNRSTIYIPEKYINMLKDDKLHGLFYFWYIISATLIDYFKILSDASNINRKDEFTEAEINELFKLNALHMTNKVYPFTDNFYPIIFGMRAFMNKRYLLEDEPNNIMEDLLNLFNEVRTFSIQDLKNYIHDEKYATSFLHDEQYNITRYSKCRIDKNFFQIHTTGCIGLNRHHSLFYSEGTHQYLIYNKNIYFFGTKEYKLAKENYYRELKNKTYKV